MTFRRVLGFAVVWLMVGGLAGCSDSSKGETNGTSSTSPTTSNGTGTSDGAEPGDSSGAGNTKPGTTTTNVTPTSDDVSGGGDTDAPTNPNPGFCPADQPAAGSECTTAFPAACDYADGGCVCTDGAWDCYSASDCPAAAPADGDSCELNAMACSFGELNCTCNTTNGWSCNGPCPDGLPADGDSCRRPTNQTCGYTEGALVEGFGTTPDTSCACTNEAFVCSSQADCPADAPTTGAACEFPTLRCAFTGANCQCSADGTWTCTTDCPDALPSDGASCDRPEQAACRYTTEGGLAQGGMGGGTVASTCTCLDQAFSCLGQEDCPAGAPASGDACTDLVGLACTYDGSDCNCSDTGWTCVSECPAAPPEDGAGCERTQPCRYAAGELLAGGGGGFGGGQGGARADTSCACTENAFDCFTPADCPTTVPGDDVTCSVSGVLCVVEGQNCTCSGQSNTWTCFTPPDGGATGPGPDPSTEPVETTDGIDTSAAISSETPSTLDAGAL